MKNFLIALLVISLFSCTNKEKADLLVYNATIYTVDSSFSTAEAMAIKDGKILAVGKMADLEKEYESKEKLDAQGKFIYPGFIDAHAHFTGYGLGLETISLFNTASWDDVIHNLGDAGKSIAEGKWIIGRGWDQNDWDDKNFPTNERLNKMFPNNPVLLTRVDGHAAIANQKALDIAGIKAGDTLTGGEIEEMEGTLTGILIDNAVDFVSSKIPKPTEEEFKYAMGQAEKNCFAVGWRGHCGCRARHWFPSSRSREDGRATIVAHLYSIYRPGGLFGRCQ